MANLVDARLFEDLAGKKADDVVLPPFCVFDAPRSCYRITVWNNTYEIEPHASLIRVLGKSATVHEYFSVFLINYMLSVKKNTPTGEWISEKDLVGGPTFFRGPHEIPTKLICDFYANDLKRLRSKCIFLGGKELSLADCSYSFDIVASVRVALLYWQGDEDFPPEAKLLLDSSVAETLKLDVIYALLCDVCSRLVGK